MPDLDNNPESLVARLAELEKLVKQNLAVTQEVKHKVTKIQHWIFWQKLYHWLKLTLLVLIILAAYIYLPPLIQKVISPYQSLLQQTSGLGNSLNSFNLNQLDLKNINLDQILKGQK